MRPLATLVSLLLFFISSQGWAQSECRIDEAKPIILDRSNVVQTISKQNRYTQGLLIRNGQIYESTGFWKHSGIYVIHPNGDDSELAKLHDKYFGEGLTFFGDTAFQLTWQAGIAFSYNFSPSASRQAPTKNFSYTGEGWGLTTLGNELVMSDGSSKIKFLNPNDFAVTRTITVRYGSDEIDGLNELEAVNGSILSNVYGQNYILQIDATNGCVQTPIDATPLVESIESQLGKVEKPICGDQCSEWDFVINGIAYDSENDQIYITGKNWPFIFVFDNFLK